jgi:hypothetical protein
VLSWSWKKSHLACNHEAHISLKLWRRVYAINANPYLLVAATLCGKEAGDLWLRNILADACGAICLSFQALARLS